MAVAVDNTTKVVTISGTSSASPQTIESVIDGIVAVSATEAARSTATGWIGGTWQIAFTAVTDFLIISKNFTAEFRASAAIRFTAGIILAANSTLVYSRTAGLGFGNLATFQSSSCQLICRRLNNLSNPRVIINCTTAAARSDIFGSTSVSVRPTHTIEGLDIFFGNSGFGFIKLYLNAASTAANINIHDSTQAVQQFYSSSTTESGCPVFSSLFFDKNNISGDFGSISYVRLINCIFKESALLFQNYRQTAFVVVDGIFLAGIPTDANSSDSAVTSHSPLELRYTYALKFRDLANAGIAGARIRFYRSDGVNLDRTTPANGILPTEELRIKFKPSGVGADGGSTFSYPFTSYTWTIKQRIYAYDSSSELLESSSSLVMPTSNTVFSALSSYVTISETAAGNISGITLDKTTKTISTTANKTLGDIFHFYRYFISQFTNFDTTVFALASATTLFIRDGWKLMISSPSSLTVSSALKDIETASNITLSDVGIYLIPINILAGGTVTVATGATDLSVYTFVGSVVISAISGTATVTVNVDQLANVVAGAGVTIQTASSTIQVTTTAGASVSLRKASDNSLIVQGTSDGSGNFTVVYSGFSVSAILRVRKAGFIPIQNTVAITTAGLNASAVLTADGNYNPAY